MRRTIKKRLTLLLCAALLFICCAQALAVEMKASAGSASVTEGEEIEVTLTISGKSMAVAEGVFSYDPTLLSFKESSGGAGDGFINMATAEKGGSSTLSANMRFTALKAGEAKISFTLENLLDYEGEKLEGGTAETSVSIAAAPAEEKPKIDYSKEGVEAQNVQGAAETMYVWKSIENVTIPSKYLEAELDYHGEKVKGATVKDTDAPTLLYLSNAAGENGAYYIFDQEKDLLYPYRTISSVSKSYILMQPDASVQIPEGFAQGSLTVDEREVAVWKSQDAAGEVYLVYARNPDGEMGFYYYNPLDASLQRYSVLPARPVQPQLTPSPAPTIAPAPTEAIVAEPETAQKEGTITVPELYAYGLCGAVIILLLALIIVLASHAAEKKRRRERAAQRRAERECAEREKGQNFRG